MDLGRGNMAAATQSRGNAMASVDTFAQSAALLEGTLRRRRRPRPSEVFGQTLAAPSGAASVAAGGTDPFWGLAKTHAGPSAFPWRRELALSEQVAMLTRDENGGPHHHPGGARSAPGSASGGKTSSAGGGGGGTGARAALFGSTDRPGLDAAGRQSTRLATLPAFPYNTAGGRVVVNESIVLPAGMGIRHPASYAADKFQADITEYLALWALSDDAHAAKAALGEKIDALWHRHLCFRAWAKAVYGVNRRRAGFFRSHPMRITVVCPDGRPCQLRISALATGLDVKRMLESKRRPREAGRRGFVGMVRLSLSTSLPPWRPMRAQRRKRGKKLPRV